MVPPPSTTMISTVNSNTTAVQSTPATLLSLPVELRIQIYKSILVNSHIQSFRPQRRIGWNRPHADLTNPALLFESDAHISLRQLFHSKLTKSDHALILEVVLHHAKVLVIDHADFTALLKIARSVTTIGQSGAATGTAGGTTGTSGPSRPLSLVSVVRDHLRHIDFNDRMDESVCQPSDVVKLLHGFPGLRSVCLTSRHVQRYSGTIDDHIEFARERGARETQRQAGLDATKNDHAPLASPNHADNVTKTSPQARASELRRLTLRSPMTDGTRMVISPALFTSTSTPKPTATGTSTSTGPGSQTHTWVTVDLSMLIWQHFLYTGPPYRDHWRTIKISTLLDVAAELNISVILSLRNIEFDPFPPLYIPTPPGGSGNSGADESARTRPRPYTPTRRTQSYSGGLFKGEMNSTDWVLRLKQVGKAGGLEYSVRQRRVFDVGVGQDGCGVLRCRHRCGIGGVCERCTHGSGTVGTRN